jgi:hypothetical protein
MLDLSRQGVLSVLPALDVLSKQRQVELESSVLSDAALAQLVTLLSLDSGETRYLGLSNTKLGKRVAKIAPVLAANDKLEYLDLGFSDLDDAAVEDVLLPALTKNFSLVSVNLRGNDLKHRTLGAVEALLRRNQVRRAEIADARNREQRAMLREEFSARARDAEIAELVAEVEGVQRRRLARLAKWRSFWASEVAKAEARELQLLSALTVEAEERKEGRKGKKGKKGKK